VDDNIPEKKSEKFYMILLNIKYYVIFIIYAVRLNVNINNWTAVYKGSPDI